MLAGEQRFGIADSATEPRFHVDVCDFDQRLMVRIILPQFGEFPDLDDMRRTFDSDRDLAMDIAAQQFNRVPLDESKYRGVKIGEVISLSGADFSIDTIQGVRPVDTISRSELVELDRFKKGVDLCYYKTEDSEEKMVVIKYPCFPLKGVELFWNELNVMLRLPQQSSDFLHVDRLIVDENDPTRVVGFATPYVPGADLGRNWQDRPFKIKWMRQLMRAVDDLNLQLGIVHQDLAGRNFLLNSGTDELVLCDFHLAKRYYDTRNPEMDDVKGLVLAVHDLITHDDRYFAKGLWELNEKELTSRFPEDWQKHDKVLLDEGLDVQDYYDELMAWANQRRSAGLGERPAKQIDWPEVRYATADPTLEKTRLQDMECYMSETSRPSDYYELLKKRHAVTGHKMLEWARPAASELDVSRRLLVTGKYAEEDMA